MTTTPTPTEQGLGGGMTGSSVMPATNEGMI